MQFSTSFLALLASASVVIASPAPAAKYQLNARDAAEVQLQSDAIAFAAQQADCNLFQCAGLVAAVGCVTLAMGTGPAAPAAVLACVAGGAGTICPCASCIPGLDGFLERHRICE